MSWVTVFVAALTYGATVVPLTENECTADAVRAADARILFVGDDVFARLDASKLDGVWAAISLDTKQLLWQADSEERAGRCWVKILRNLTRRFRSRFRRGFTRNDIDFEALPDGHVAVLCRRGTGFDGMTVDELSHTVCRATEWGLCNNGAYMAGVLPLGTRAGWLFNVLVPLVEGAHVTLAGPEVSGAGLMAVVAEVAPRDLLCTAGQLTALWNTVKPGLGRRRRLRAALGGRCERVAVADGSPDATIAVHLRRMGIAVSDIC